MPATARGATDDQGPRMRVLIAGCGFVGSALAARLVHDGHEVFGVARCPDGLPTGVRPIATDLADPAGASAIPETLDWCVTAVSADGRSPTEYQDAYVSVLAHLRDQLRRTSPELQRWVFTSSTGVYGQRDGQWVDEDSPTQPARFTGATMLEAERLLRRSGVGRPVVLRLAGIYGPGRTRLLDRIARGEAVVPPEPTYTNRIHRDDAAGALHHILTLDEPELVYLGADSDPAERSEVYSWLAARLGAPPPRTGDEATGSKRVRNARLLASGYTLTYPSFRDGYGAMIDGQAADDPAP